MGIEAWDLFWLFVCLTLVSLYFTATDPNVGLPPPSTESTKQSEREAKQLGRQQSEQMVDQSPLSEE